MHLAKITKGFNVFLVWLLCIICCSYSLISYAQSKKNLPFNSVDIPLNRPNLSDETIEKWVRSVVVQPYHFNPENYAANKKAIAQFFTFTGWNDVEEKLQQIGTPEQIEKNKISVSAVINGKIIIIRKGLMDNHFYWQVVVPIQISYKGRAITRSESLLANLIITRVDKLVSEQGIAIMQYTTSVRAIS